MSRLLHIFLTIAIGFLGGSALGLYTDINGAIVGAITGALLFTYVKHFRPNKMEAEG